MVKPNVDCYNKILNHREMLGKTQENNNVFKKKNAITEI